LVEYGFGLQFVDARLFVEVDPVEEIFFVIGHHYIQVLLCALVSGETAQHLHHEVIFDHVYDLKLTIAVA